ncbi:hypothetical protein JCM10213v2_002726 [Rhodosporidiobolus nylandii]
MITFFSCIWGIIAGAAVLRRRSDGDLTSKIDTIYLVLAILYFICAGLEAFGFFAAWRANIALVQAYFWCSATIALVVTASELMRTVVHFTDKSSIISACQNSYSSDISSGTTTSSAVEEYCKDSWRNQSYIDIALLLFSFFIAFFFASLAASYLHQLRNPQLLRTHEPQLGAASNQYAYPLQPYGPGGAPPYPGVAPYGPPSYGPSQPLPSYDNPYGQSVSDDKTPAAYPAPAQNPFEEHVQHGSELVRREGESAEDFERRQDEHDRARFAESTETIKLGGRDAEGRV